MARGNMLLGQAYGSVGDITFSRNNGKQIIKSKPSKVSNPQSKAQMIQRVLLNTIAQAYSKMSSICDHSFEGISAGQMSMAYFMQRNLKLLRFTLSQIGDLDSVAPLCSPIGTNGLASNSYVVSKGSLPEISPVVSTGAVAIALTENTYQAVLEATGMQRGDQLTILTVSGSDLTKQKFVFSRIILDPVDENGASQPLSTAFIVEGAINCPSERNENNGHEYAFENGNFEVSPIAAAVNMGACIASRQKEDGSWLRSNAALLLAEGAEVGYNMQTCLDLFEAGGIDVESSRYLNNAIKMARQAQSGGSVTPSTPSAPVITGEATFTTTTQAVISAANGAAIRYTTDGSDPTTASTLYSGPITLSATTTVKAIAVLNGVASSVASKTFTKSDDEDIPGQGGNG